MIGYKLTDHMGQTYGGTQWGPGVTHEAPGTGDLCTSGWIHLYDDTLVAAMMNPIHAHFDKPRLWRCEWSGATRDDHGLKRGRQRCTTVEELPVPVVTTEQRIRFGILVAKRVCSDPGWNQWADRWLSGEDRSRLSAADASWSAEAAWSAADASWSAEAAWSAAAWSAAEAAARAAQSPLDIAAIAREAVESEPRSTT